MGNSQLTRSQRAADGVAQFAGSWTFIVAFSTLTAVWVILNSVLALSRVFDPYPYIFLNLILTVVSTFQGPLIMMSLEPPDGAGPGCCSRITREA